MLDTQIFSRHFAGKSEVDIVGQGISSTSACEFLMMQTEQPTKASYYVPLDFSNGSDFLHAEGHLLGKMSRNRPFPKSRTDQVVMDLGHQYGSYIHFGNVAIAGLINNRNFSLYDMSIEFIKEKSLKKTLRERFRFLIENNVSCICLSPQAVDSSLDLFAKFVEKYNPKDNYRNTINDMLILALAFDLGIELLTQDSLLRRFSAEIVGANYVTDGSIVRIQKHQIALSRKKAMPESKSYINKGWRANYKNFNLARR